MRAAHILLFTASALVSGVQVLPEGDPEYRHLVINEIGDKGTDDTCNDEDWVELFNPTASDVSLVGVMIVDDKGHGDEGMVTLGDDTPNTEESGMPAKGAEGCPKTLPAGKMLLLCKEGSAILDGTEYPGCGFGFGIGGDDSITLFHNATHAYDHVSGKTDDDPSGCCGGDSANSYGLASRDGTGVHRTLPVRTPGRPNLAGIHISEVASSGGNADACAGEDYIELHLPAAAVSAASLIGLALSDDKGLVDGDPLTLAAPGCPQELQPGSYLLLCKEIAGPAFIGTVAEEGTTLSAAIPGCGFDFGIGGDDTVTLWDVSGTAKMIDTTGVLSDKGTAVQSEGRAIVGGVFGLMPHTGGAPNIDPSTVVFSPPPPSPPKSPPPPMVAHPIVISEVAATGDPADPLCGGEDWIELWNPSAAATSLTDMVLADDKGHGHEDRLVLGNTTRDPTNKKDPCPTSLGAGQYLVFCKEGAATIFEGGVVKATHGGCGMSFGVGKDDTILLYKEHTNSESLVDFTPGCCHSGTSDQSFSETYGRTSHDGSGGFDFLSPTPGLKNYADPPPSPSPPPPPSSPVDAASEASTTAADEGFPVWAIVVIIIVAVILVLLVAVLGTVSSRRGGKATAPAAKAKAIEFATATKATPGETAARVA